MFLTKIINKGYEAENCQLCQVQFNLMKFQRIHKCKRCHKFICIKCGKNKQKILDPDGKWTKQSHRMCIPCHKDFLQIHDTITENDMQWNRDTTISNQWLKNIQKDCQQIKDYEYNHFLRLFNQNLKMHEQQVEIIDKDVIKGRTDSSVFNFSMREFFYSVKADVENEVSRENIKNVLYAVAARHDKIGYCQGMSGVAAFLLCFSSQKTAFILFCDLLQNTYPPDMFLKNDFGVSLSGLLAQTHFLQEYFIHLLTNIKKPLIQKVRGQFYSEDELNHFRTIIQLFGSKALLSLFVGILSFSNCIFIWHQIKQHRSFEVVERAFLAVIYLNRENILENRSFKILEQIFQRITLQQFREFYEDVYIDKQLRERIFKQHSLNLRKKWDSIPSHQIRNLTKITNFTEDELIKLKNNFPEDQQTKLSIKRDDLVNIILLYNRIERQYFKNHLLYQINPQYVKDIIKNYPCQKIEGFDFRQFIICLSQCVRITFKDQLKLVIGTFKDSQGYIMFDYDKFSAFLNDEINSIQKLKVSNQKKNEFEKRMSIYFGQSKKLLAIDIQPLLNDSYIQEISQVLKTQKSNILDQVLKQFKNSIN